MIDPLIIIPAKGTSTRIPRKNVVIYEGKPLIQWSIEYSLGEGYIPTVISDDDEILKFSESLGANIEIEPNNLLDKHVDYVTRYMSDKFKKDIILLQATSPKRPRGLIDKVIELIPKFDSVYGGFPLPGHFVIDKRGKLVNRKYKENGEVPFSQELIDEPQWIQSGVIFGYKFPITQTGTLIGNVGNVGNVGVVDIDFEYMIDIDYPCDLK